MRFSAIFLPLVLCLTAASTPVASPQDDLSLLLIPTITTPERLAAIQGSLTPEERLASSNSTFHTFRVNTTLIPNTSRDLREIIAECNWGGNRVDAGDAYMAGMWLSKRNRDCTQVEAFATQMARNKWARLYMLGYSGWTEPCYFMGQTAMRLVDHCARDKDNSVLADARFWYAGQSSSNRLLRIVKGSRSA